MDHLVLWYSHAEPGVPLLEVCGLSLIKRAVLTAQKAEVAHVEIAAHGADVEAISAELADPRVTLSLNVTADPQGLEPLLGGAPEIGLILGDRVFLKKSLDHLAAPLEPDIGARPLCAEGAPLSGIFRLRADVAAVTDPGTTAGGLKTLPGAARVEALVVERCWSPVRRIADVPAAEVVLIRSLTKTADGIIARNINRKLSGRLTRVLAPYPVHPNMVTAVVALIGVLSLPLGAMGTWAGFAFAGLCYYVSSVLDGVDGELSRLKFLASPLGAWLDTITDDVVGTAYLVGLFYGLDRYADHPWWGWAGLVTLVGYFLTLAPRYWLMIASVGVGDHQAISAARLAEEKGAFGRAVDAVASTVFRIDFLTFAACVLGFLGLHWFFAAACAVGTVISVVETAYTVNRLRRGAST